MHANTLNTHPFRCLSLFVLCVVVGRGGGFGGLGGRRDRKHLQVYIPLFLAFNAVGWMVLAIKTVGVLTMKALLVSKLALIVTTFVIAKRMMDRATER